MNTILIATDFSRVSGIASLYGVQLAKAIKAKVILFNAYKVPTAAPGLNVGISRYDVMIQTKEKLQEEAEKIHYINIPRLEILCDEGEADNTIIKIAIEKKADFIVVGTQGPGKNLKKIFGSTATSLATKSDIPVIIVPQETRFSVPKIIMHASDNISDTSIHPVNTLKTITDFFKCKLYVVRVVEGEYVKVFEQVNTQENLEEEPGKLNAFQLKIKTDIRHALNDFIKKYHVDMLVMIPHKHQLLERLFRKSETRDMIFHTHIPLMVLPEVFLEQLVHKKKFFKIQDKT